MRTRVKTIMAASLIAATPAVFAATQGDVTKTGPAENTGQMMQDDSGMGHGMGMKHDGQMPMMKMMSQMNEMMETCNKMMQSKMEKSKPSGDGSEQN